MDGQIPIEKHYHSLWVNLKRCSRGANKRIEMETPSLKLPRIYTRNTCESLKTCHENLCHNPRIFSTYKHNAFYSLLSNVV